MKEKEFYAWLIKTGYEHGTANSRTSNCLTVCTYEGDLNKYFAKDKCKELLERLSYSTDDERHNRPPKHNIPINGNIRTGSATLKQAVTLYVKFLNGETLSPKKEKHTNTHLPKGKNKRDWPVWEQPTDEESFEMAKVITNYVRFLSPDIIKAIVVDNEKIRHSISNILAKKEIDCNLYLWEKSSCCFPGVRRCAGSAENSAYKKHSTLKKTEDAIELDDNNFPKQIWSFVFRGSQFSKFGPSNYNLAHLIDHKKDKNRMKEEFIFPNDYIFEKPFYGLFTCASNSIYVLNTLMKPTDFNSNLRNLLFHKALALYGNYCNIVPPFIKMKQPTDSKWDISNFHWCEPVGTLDNIEIFLDFRKRKLEEIFGEKF